nr:hypothetical protein [Candidatus Enterousia merdequi]
MKSFGKEFLLKLFWIASFGLVSGIHFNGKHQPESNPSLDTTHITETIPYKTDTLQTTPKAVMYYTKNQIVRNYVDNDNKYQMRLPFFAHEIWHHHNYKYKHSANTNMTPYEYFKLCAWDEISANICAALTARYEYLCSNNPDSVLNTYAHTCLKFYVDDIKAGKIKPNMDSISDNECKLLIDGSVTDWMTKYFKAYKGTHEDMVLRHFHTNKFFATKPSHYNQLRNKMLYIGGIKFASFLDKDIDLYDSKILILEQMFGIRTLDNVWEPVFNKIIENYDDLSQMDKNDRKRVLWNIVASEKIKHTLESINITDVAGNKNTVQKTYDIIIKEMLADYNLNVWVSNFSPFTMQKTMIKSPDNIIKQAYKYNDTYLSDFINTENNSGTLSYTKTLATKSYSSIKPLLESTYSKETKHNQDSVDIKTPQHRSETQYIDLPNFYIPILKNTTKPQQNEIREIITKYESIPTVLKLCDTKAQIEYLKHHQR